MSTTTYANNIHTSLRQLINMKAARDNCKFNVYMLAKALDMPHSMLVKLTHADPLKRVVNPRIDTLSKIVRYFQQDGFTITLEEFISGMIPKAIDVDEQVIKNRILQKAVPLLDMDFASNKIGTIDVFLTSRNESVIAFIAKQDIIPFFKRGSIFIVDPTTVLTDGTMVLLKNTENKEIIVGKYFNNNGKRSINTLNGKQLRILFNPIYEILGTVIQVNAKT